ncbi:putative disease resistance RPP13-like protein 3 [Sorghum bicolor]|uniref:AAA+ ATPase domain-containing protein n=1 Tax=Sorghum bicolor TaxID=4558 RepID=C5XYF5_SORBI|nr:putative disease resistance RPP13-like protein 3 [Sorghum bicolor]EES06528.1 hypothetical protein SORBI_3004G095600 [Sorghum bicolor]|eukprot:XP_002453552.1 putative disease resistance RPP13-like protein 3 [Sorghum bicolor]
MESAAQSVVSKLGQLVVDELQDIRGVGDKVVHLMDELSTMNAALRMISEADQSSVDHLTREWEKQVRELAYDAEDCADIYRLRVNVNRRPASGTPPPPNHRRWYHDYGVVVTWSKHLFDKLQLRRALAAEVRALLARTGAVSERRARYGIDRAVLPRSSSCWLTPVSTAAALRHAHDPDQLVGIGEQVTALAERIKAAEDDDDGDRRLKVFSIVGFGGLGKTTLAVELCRQLDADFQCQALVSVSQAFDGDKDMKGLLGRVLHQIVKVKQDEAAKVHQMDVEHLYTKLKDLLRDKRYLIVIDDVWSLSAWEAIHVRLLENNCNSRVIVTTRIETVAKAASVSEDLVHHMKPLEPKASQELFIKRVFGSMGTCPNGLKEIMRKILKRCGGLPLAIVRIAGLLACYNSDESVEMWIRVSNSIGSQMESHPTLEGMRQVITLSYDYLPHHLKACMMYLSIFPEDYVIAKDRLLYRWIAEGLVAEKRGLTLFDVAEEYFNELISRNMIQPDKLSITGSYRYMVVEACRVHDMMLEVMVSKSQEANFVSLVGRQYRGVLAHGKVRRLSVHGNDNEPINPIKNKVEQRHHARHGIEAMNLQHVRSLTTFQVEGLDKLLDRLGEFKLLRVLDLEDCKTLQDKHMRDVCRLYLLRFLGLRGTQINVMPSKIGDLEFLETLDVEQGGIIDMPPTVTKLSKLERLKVRRWILPPGLGNMKALREVAWAFLQGDVHVAEEIGELQQLQFLSIELGGEPKEDFLQALASSLSKTYALRSLHLSTYHRMTLDFLLHVSSPPPLLRCLIMNGPISRFPNWISSLNHLVEFTMRRAQLAGDQLLDCLCKLPNLQTIELGSWSCKNRELVARTTHKFPGLRTLNLSSFFGDPEVVKFEQGSMTKLEKLLVEFSNETRSIVGIENLKNLKEVKLRGKENNLSLELAQRQLKEENQNRPKSNQIKVVAGCW